MAERQSSASRTPSPPAPRYRRFAEDRIRTALGDTPVVALNGPRQSGKTTLVRQLAGKDRTYLTLDDATTLEAARRDPVGFVRELDTAIIDEVQRAPELLLAIKKSVDEDRRPGRFLLTGSAHILTIPRVEDSLAGRMEVVSLYPLSRAEVIGRRPTFLSRIFQGRVPAPVEALTGDDLIQQVLTGGYPEALSRSSKARHQAWCRAYVKALIERDVREIAAVEKLALVPSLFEALAQFSGQLLNLSEIGGRLGLDHKTVDRYTHVLGHLFLVRRLRPWFKNGFTRLIKTPKIHVLDTGLLASMRRLDVSQLRADRNALGPLFESFVHGEIVKQCAWSDDDLRLSHYRDKDQVEVDVVIENGANEMVGIEVKAAASVQSRDFHALERLARANGNRFKCGVVFYDGDSVLPFGQKLFAAPFPSLWS